MKYPDGDAGAVRIGAFAKICQQIGLTPVVIGFGDNTGFRYREEEGIQYCSLRFRNRGIFFRILGRAFFGVNAILYLKRLESNPIAGIMSDCEEEGLLNYLKHYASSRNIPMIYSSVEWYSPSEFSRGERSISYKINDKLNRKIIDKSMSVISISTYLEEYFKGKNITTLRIPAIIDVSGTKFASSFPNPQKIKIVYAGTPGTKDRLAELVEAFSELPAAEQACICIRIIGISKEQFEASFWDAHQPALPDALAFEGRQSRKYVLDAVADADFAFLLRPADERYAKAGFPTKVAEALACGTAMLCNLTSDLGLYLHDEENSVVIADATAEACKSALQRILLLSPEKIQAMKKKARETAERCFDWRNYVRDFEELVFMETGE